MMTHLGESQVGENRCVYRRITLIVERRLAVEQDGIQCSDTVLHRGEFQGRQQWNFTILEEEPL